MSKLKALIKQIFRTNRKLSLYSSCKNIANFNYLNVYQIVSFLAMAWPSYRRPILQIGSYTVTNIAAVKQLKLAVFCLSYPSACLLRDVLLRHPTL